MLAVTSPKSPVPQLERGQGARLSGLRERDGSQVRQRVRTAGGLVMSGMRVVPTGEWRAPPPRGGERGRSLALSPRCGRTAPYPPAARGGRRARLREAGGVF